MDRITKFALVLIALGLWANALRPMVANADPFNDILIQGFLKSIEKDFHEIASGRCGNPKIC